MRSPERDHDEPPGSPGGFKGCHVKLARPARLCTKIFKTKEILSDRSPELLNVTP